MVEEWFWYCRFCCYLFTCYMSVFLQNGSNNVNVLSLPEHSWSLIPGLWYCPDLNGSFGTNVKFGNNLILSHHTLPATFHKFLLLYHHLKLQLCWFLIQYCNMTWSYFITYFKWFYTENKHNLLHLKYTNKEREIQTTRHMEWGVHAWCACLLVSLLYFHDVLVCMFVSAVARYIP